MSQDPKVSKVALSLLTWALATIAVVLSATLQYMILSRVPGTTDLMWFMFWFNIPVVFILRALIDVIKKEQK